MSSVSDESAIDSINAALMEMGEVLSKSPRASMDRQGSAEFLLKALQTAPDQFSGDSQHHDVELPFNTVATLLAHIIELRFDNAHLQRADEAHTRDTGLLFAADRAHLDKRESDKRARYDNMAEALGMKPRVERNKYESLSAEAQRLASNEGLTLTAACKRFSDRPGAGSPETLRQGIMAYRRRQTKK